MLPEQPCHCQELHCCVGSPLNQLRLQLRLLFENLFMNWFDEDPEACGGTLEAGDALYLPEIRPARTSWVRSFGYVIRYPSSTSIFQSEDQPSSVDCNLVTTSRSAPSERRSGRQNRAVVRGKTMPKRSAGFPLPRPPDTSHS